MSINLTHVLIIGFTLLILIGLSRQSFKLEETFGHTGSYSSDSDVAAGASAKFNWGKYQDTKLQPPKKKDDTLKPFSWTQRLAFDAKASLDIGKKHKKEKKCKKIDKKHCYDCDITTNKDIGKYVLKSSIPPCPDMSEYAKKSGIPPNIDLSKYILKSKVPKCECPNMNDYIKKTDIPPCPETPLCPKCPICPVCPTFDASKWISKDKVKKNYIKKSEVDAYCRSIVKTSININPYGNQPIPKRSPKKYPDSGVPKVATETCPDYSKYAFAKNAPKPFNSAWEIF